MLKDMNGTLNYTRATVEIFFPENDVRCQLCPLLQTYSRNQCMRTGELIPDARGRGLWCPLELEGDKER